MRRATLPATMAIGAFAFVLGVGGPATAGPALTQTCEAAKFKLVCKKTCCELGIAAKGRIDFSKCMRGFAAGFGKIKGTCGAGEPTLETKVDAFRTDVTNELKPARNKCEAGKLKAVCKKVCCELGADGKAVVKGRTPDFIKCKSSFGATFAKLETKGSCASTGDATAIENKVDAFTTDVFTEVTVPGGTTTSTVAHTTTSTSIAGTTSTSTSRTSTTSTSSTSTTTAAGGCSVATDCPVRQACNTSTHRCTTACGGAAATPCNGGCCNVTAPGSGTCVAGDADTQCGNSGGLCDDCVVSCNLGPKCIAGTCGCSSDADCTNDAMNCDPFLRCAGGACS